jgi:holo-[acyl-carrier protein] synthase
MERAAVVQVLTRISRKTPSDILDHLSLASLGVSTSLGLSLLRSGLEAASGRRLSSLAPQLKVGELVGLVNGTANDLEASARTSSVASNGDITLPAGTPEELGLGLGLDIQDLESMPVASDYRTHEFYRTHFQPAELATALLRPDPRMHLCGVFCAKEAAKKSHPELLELRMEAFVVTHAASGRPALQLIASEPLAKRFRFMLSISHARGFAVAACITRWSLA